MRWTLAILIALLALPGATVKAADVDGNLTVGGVVIDEEGNTALMQERFNLYDGVTLAEFGLRGRMGERQRFRLGACNVTFDNRTADFEYSLASMLKITSRYRQHRQLFDPDSGHESMRKNLRLGLRATPVRWAHIVADYSLQKRDGSRVTFPAGTPGPASSDYDYTLNTTHVGAQLTKSGYGLSLDYDLSDFGDNITPDADRTGTVFSAGAHAPDPLLDRVTHVIRGSIGKSEFSNLDSDYTLKTVQYTGVAGPFRRVKGRYRFFGSRVDESTTGMLTDNLIHDVDLTYMHRYGDVTGGYGYETLDDDIHLTDYDVYRAGFSLHSPGNRVRARARYNNRRKTDIEKLTLLKETGTETWGGRLEVKLTEDASLAGTFARRDRELPDIGVDIDGERASAHAHYYYEYWGDMGVVGATIDADYIYTNDDYKDITGGFRARSNFVGSRLALSIGDNWQVSGGLTYVNIGADLDIEKVVVSSGVRYTFRDDYHLEAKYNVMNYDDFIVADRYYSANIFWINLGYDFSLKQEAEEED